MKKPIDLTGQRFGRLVVQECVGRRCGHALWSCLCDCGNVIEVIACDLKKGHTASCGCLQRERSRESATVHGGQKTRLYEIWCAMKARCNRRTDESYKDYGGRGITVCDEWANSFEAFRKWALSNGYQNNLSIDRKDNDGPYCPENCRWATAKQQNNNQRSNRVITHNGESHTIAEWAELVGIKYDTLRRRLNKGWSVERALTTETKGATP